MQVTATDFKTHCLQYLDKVGKTDEPIFISKRGKVIAKLVPVIDSKTEKPWEILQRLGAETTDDLLEPVAIDDWKLLP
jgi:prevent-host-death family protein